MMPGMNQVKDQIANIDEREIDRIEAIIKSMTPAERTNPKMLDGSRRSRIAAGSGTKVSDVNSLVNRFFEARKMMQSLGGAMGGGIPGMPGGRRAITQQRAKPKGKGKGVSGNPAKRAGGPPAAAPAETQPAWNPADAFGLGGGQLGDADLQKALGDYQLPPEVQRMLNAKNQGPR